MVAIIPAAGRGSRMTTVTRGAPKELLPLGRGTVLGRIVLEALVCAERVVIVNSHHKPAIDAFVETLHNDRIKVAYQDSPRGLLHAVCTAGVEDDAVVLLGDTVYRGESPLPRMVELIRRGIDGVIAVEPVATDLMEQYGIAEVNEQTGAITRILEKPKHTDTASRLAIAARYAFSKRVLAFLMGECQRRNECDGDDALSLTDGISQAIGHGFDIKAAALQPDQERIDCGSAVEYRNAQEIHWD